MKLCLCLKYLYHRPLKSFLMPARCSLFGQTVQEVCGQRMWSNRLVALQCIVVSSETSFGSGQRQTTRDAALLQLQTRIIQEKQLQLQLPSSHQGRLDRPTPRRAPPMQQMTKSVNESQMRRTFEQVMLMLVSTILYLLDFLVDSKV